MDIGFLQAYFSRTAVGGGELHTERLARALETRGHNVSIFTDKPVERRDGLKDLTIYEYPTPAKLNPINELALTKRAWDDLLNCDVVTLTDDSAWLGVDLPVPTVMVFHIVWHGWVERHRPLLQILGEKPQALLYRWMERKICRKTDSIVSISPNIREDIALIGDFQEKLRDIPNGVDIERFRPVSRKYEEFTVYFQGRLVEMKNPQLLIQAAALSGADWQLHIGGSGPLREKLESAAAKHGVEDRISFLGYVPDNELPERYARSHVFALPSDYEGMPLTVLEAAACGTAILASPRAATDFVHDGMGVVTAPNSDDIAEALDELAQQPERAARMGRAARERAEEFSWESIAREYEQLYQNLTKGKS